MGAIRQVDFDKPPRVHVENPPAGGGRVQCRVCGRWFFPRNDGMPRAHNGCPGSPARNGTQGSKYGPLKQCMTCGDFVRRRNGKSLPDTCQCAVPTPMDPL